jgi:hypothetical protein
MFLDIQIPFNIFNINIVEDILQFYRNDLQLPQTFHQEVKLWTKMWSTTRKANPKHSLKQYVILKCVHQCILA